jgi:membrane-associated phospholipid phosphatase
MESATSRRRRRILVQGLAAAALVVAASLADRWAFAHFNLPTVYDQGWGRLVRILGYLPFWVLVGFGILRSSSTSSTRRSALLLMLAPTLSGALNELLKLLVRRERPGPNAGEYVFRAFTDRPFSTAGLGMPSGDTIVAFAACTVLARAWPQARLLWYALAVACAMCRVLSHAHFLSDVTVAALLGWALAEWLWRRYGPPSTAHHTASAA